MNVDKYATGQSTGMFLAFDGLSYSTVSVGCGDQNLDSVQISGEPSPIFELQHSTSTEDSQLPQSSDPPGRTFSLVAPR